MLQQLLHVISSDLQRLNNSRQLSGSLLPCTGRRNFHLPYLASEL